MGWRVRAIRGAITVPCNSAEAICTAVTELLDTLEHRNALDPSELVSVVFSATPDLNAAFPAQFARRRPGWELVPLLDVQQMEVIDALPRCVRVLIQLNTPLNQTDMQHVYLGGARELRPDLSPV
ncbi:MAG: chorismate mutase [Thermostichus sp. DG02_5_bins_236]